MEEAWPRWTASCWLPALFWLLFVALVSRREALYGLMLWQRLGKSWTKMPEGVKNSKKGLDYLIPQWGMSATIEVGLSFCSDCLGSRQSEQEILRRENLGQDVVLLNTTENYYFAAREWDSSCVNLKLVCSMRGKGDRIKKIDRIKLSCKYLSLPGKGSLQEQIKGANEYQTKGR